MLATLTGVVGMVAIMLCVIGLYGLTASVVNRQQHFYFALTGCLGLVDTARPV